MSERDIEVKLREVYPSAVIHVEDISCSQLKYRIEVQDKAFTGMSRVKAHQAIMDIFKEELLSGDIHGLSLQVDAS